MIRFQLIRGENSEIATVMMDMNKTTVEEREEMEKFAYKTMLIGNDVVGYMKRKDFMSYTQHLRSKLE
jgi:hypothetical protein